MKLPGSAQDGRPKLVFLSNMPAPYQVKFCHALQRYFRAEFWFYLELEQGRPSWWKIPLGDRCRVLPRVIEAPGLRYWAPGLGAQLADFDPDIVMIGGLSILSNYYAYRWGKRHHRKVVALTELSRTPTGQLRSRRGVWSALRYLYRDLDAVLATSAEAALQFSTSLGFGQRVAQAQYPVDIEGHLSIPTHDFDPTNWSLIFANRLIPIYNPLAAISAFASLLGDYPGGRLRMNREGSLLQECRTRIAELGITESVDFLDNIQSWEDLPKVYAASDILLLPAHFSGGNLTIVEAMAAGLGIVVSDQIQGYGKLIKDGINGFTCSPNAASAAEAVRNYLESPSTLKAHAEKNRALARAYSPDSTAALLHRLFLERGLASR